MSYSIHYWIEYKNKNSNEWTLFNPKHKNKDGKVKEYNNNYFQGWLKDQILKYEEWNKCKFINRGYPQDLSIDLKSIIDKLQKEECNRFRFNQSYVLLSELKDFFDENVIFIETQIKNLQEDSKLEIINQNILTLGKLISKETIDRTLKELPNVDDFSEDNYVFSEYKEELTTLFLKLY